MIGRLKLYLIIAGLLAVIVLTGGQILRLRVKLSEVNQQLSKSRRMRDAAANTPTDQRSVVKRLLDGKF